MPELLIRILVPNSVAFLISLLVLKRKHQLCKENVLAVFTGIMTGVLIMALVGIYD